MYDYGWRQYMPDFARWNGMDQLSEKFHNASPYAYVMNNPAMFLDPDGRDRKPASGSWLQDMWNNTTSSCTWSSTGDGGFVGGEVLGGMSHENFTNFYNFLAGGGTGNYTYWTGGAMPSGSYAMGSDGLRERNIQGLTGHNINIKGNSDHWFESISNSISDGLEYFLTDLLYLEFSGEFSMGGYLDIGLKNGLAIDCGERSTIADFWYIKDTGSTLADYGADSDYRGDRNSYTIGGAYIGGVSFSKTSDDVKSLSVGILGLGYTRTWGSI